MKRKQRAKKPGIRLSTLMRDREILKRLKQGKAPKEVAYEMGLSSVWVVYDAVRRLDKTKFLFAKYNKRKSQKGASPDYE